MENLPKQHLRPYLRDGVAGLSLDDQRAAFKAAKIDLGSAYVDELNKAARKRRDPADLHQRAAMLKPTSRKTRECIVVARLDVFGWSMADIARCMALAGQRNATVYALDRDEVFSVDDVGARLLHALAETEEGRRRAQTKDARDIGVAVAAEKRRKRVDAKMEKARELWRKPGDEISAAEIAKQVGLSVRTLYNRLGDRTSFRAKPARKRKST